MTENLEGQLEFRSNDLISSSSLIPGNNTDMITFRAGGKVLLTPGFKASEETYFYAKSEGCADGPLPSEKLAKDSKQ